MTASDIAEGPCLALDTEFVWTRTYHARLGLVQAAPSGPFDRARLPSGPPAVMPFSADTPEERAAVLIDPSTADPAPLRAVLEDPGCTKILHDATQDLQHLCRWTGSPAPRSVFDTRIAAGFCGLPATLSLAALLEETVGVRLPKTETRTDWCHRPLSPAQLSYAAQDVAWLAAAARRLVEIAAGRGTLGWMMEEMGRFDDPALYAPPPFSEAWHRVKGASAARRDSAALRRLRALAQWREETAEARDLPRRWIVEDEVLLSAALRPPRSPQALPPRAVPPSFVPGFFAALRAADSGPQTGGADEETGEESGGGMAPRVLRDKASKLLARLSERAEAAGVAPTLLATRAEATDWILRPGTPDHPFLRGWRHEVAAQILGI